MLKQEYNFSHSKSFFWWIMVVSDFVSRRMIYRFFSLTDAVFFSNSSYKFHANFSLSHSPTLQWIRSAPCLFFGHRSGCNPLVLLFVIRLVMLYCTWSGALSLIWKCKLVTRAIAQVLRAAPLHEHIWPVLHRPCWSLVRFQTELIELVLIYKSHKYSETCYLRKIVFHFGLWHYSYECWPELPLKRFSVIILFRRIYALSQGGHMAMTITFLTHEERDSSNVEKHHLIEIFHCVLPSLKERNDSMSEAVNKHRISSEF